MEKLSIRLKSALSEILLYLSEKKVIFFFSFIAFIFYSLQLYDIHKSLLSSFPSFPDMDTIMDICYAFALGCIFTIPATLVSQSFSHSTLKKYAIQIGAGIGGSVLGYFARTGFGSQVDAYGPLYFYGIAFAIISFSLFLFIPKSDSKTYFALIFKHYWFCALLSIVVLAGASLLIYALQNLILGSNDYDAYVCCCAFCFFVVAINSFTYHLFYKREEESSGKAFKIILLYILFPIFIVLLAILYAYLIKALILFKLPNGQINWFVSFASCFYIIFYFVLREYENLAPVRFFYKFGALAFIPLICVQIPAYFIRVSAYGLTGSRYSSLLFIIFSIVTIGLTFVKKGRFCKYSLIFLSALILFDSISPFNLVNVAHKNQYGRMMRVLKKYNMFNFESNCLTGYDRAELENAISDQDRENLWGSWQYVAWKSDIPLPDWMKEKNVENPKNADILSFQELFGIRTSKSEQNIVSFSLSCARNADAYEIGHFSKFARTYDYKYFREVNEEDNKKVTISTLNGDYDLAEFFLSLSQKDEKKPLFYQPDENTAFLFYEIDYDYNKDQEKFQNYSWDGMVFYK